MCTVADKGSALFHERCYYDLTELSVGNRFARLRVYDLNIQEVVPVMHTLFFGAVYADAGAVYLCESVYIIQLYAKLVVYPVTHLLAPALRADDALFQLDLVA